MKKNQKNTPNNSRRDFIKTGLAASSIMIIPRHVLGGVGYTAPSDQLMVATIGAGGKGISDIKNAYLSGKVKIVALCDVDPNGAHGVTQIRKEFPKAKFYTDFRELFDKEKNIDATTVSTPDHTHAVIAMNAMQRNKHIYLQKPLTHNILEARLLTDTARNQKVVTQMGNQGASNPGMKEVQKWIDKGLIGKVTKVEVWTNRPVWPQGFPMQKPNSSKTPKGMDWDLWLGPASEREYTPNIHPFNWRGYWEYGTGALGDMGCHLIDVPYRVLGLGYPTAVECSVGSVYSKMWTPDYTPEACPPSSSVTISYKGTSKTSDNLKMSWSDGGIRPSLPEIIPKNITIDVKDNANGVIMHGEKGVITTGTYGLAPKLFRKNQDPVIFELPKVKVEEPEHGHNARWVEACIAGFDSKQHKSLTSSFDYAGPLTETVLMGNIAIRSYMLRKENKNKTFDYYGRKKLIRKGNDIKIANLDEANQFITREYRKGWEIK